MVAAVTADEQANTPPLTSSRFALPKTNEEVIEARKSAIPKKTAFMFGMHGDTAEMTMDQAVQYQHSLRWICRNCLTGWNDLYLRLGK